MKISIMVVDDEPIAAQATALMAARAGDDLEVAGVCHSGRDAVQKAALLRPDLVVMDIQMPGINGLEAMRRIKKDNPGTQFIILSAYSEFGYAVEALALGASDYLLKPVRQEDLNASIQKSVADLLAKKSEMDRDLQQRERLEIALPMVKKDFIRALVPGAGADEKLVACATFLGLMDKPGFMLALSGQTDAAMDAMRAVLDKLSYATAGLFYEAVAPRLTAAYVPAPEGADETGPRLDALLLRQRDKGAPLWAGRGGLAQGVGGLKLSLVQATGALHRAEKTDAAACLVFDEATMEPRYPGADAPDTQSLPEGNPAGKIIERAVRYIRENYGRDLTLDEIAAHMNLSPFYFSRFFKEATGTNFSEMLLNIRIEHAKELLAGTDASVKDVAFRVGFNDPNYFSRVFHKAVGIKASDYRALGGKE